MALIPQIPMFPKIRVGRCLYRLGERHVRNKAACNRQKNGAKALGVPARAVQSVSPQRGIQRCIGERLLDRAKIPIPHECSPARLTEELRSASYQPDDTWRVA